MEAIAVEKHQEHKEKVKQVYHEVAKVVVGQEYMVNRLMIGLFTNGHVLLEGVPGLAKTLTVSTLAQVLHLEFQRIQFTPDLLPPPSSHCETAAADGGVDSFLALADRRKHETSNRSELDEIHADETQDRAEWKWKVTVGIVLAVIMSMPAYWILSKNSPSTATNLPAAGPAPDRNAEDRTTAQGTGRQGQAGIPIRAHQFGREPVAFAIGGGRSAACRNAQSVDRHASEDG